MRVNSGTSRCSVASTPEPWIEPQEQELPPTLKTQAESQGSRPKREACRKRAGTFTGFSLLKRRRGAHGERNEVGRGESASAVPSLRPYLWRGCELLGARWRLSSSPPRKGTNSAA